MSSSAPTESPRTNRAAIADNGVKTPPASSKNNLAVPSTALPKPEDFDLGDDLGHGSYSDVSNFRLRYSKFLSNLTLKVVKATYKTTGRVYAAKIINKEKLTRNKKVKYAIIERDALTKLHKNGAGGHPGIVKLYWTFQDKYNLCKCIGDHE
jgi:3-phosphoinositide dependent protein kinase-1